MKFVNFLKRNFICTFKGHVPETHLTETEGHISTKRCSRCKVGLMGGFMWKFKQIPPPNSTSEQIKEWEQFCEDEWQKLRDTCLTSN